MHTAWSAKRTWRLFRSASEYTATVLRPSSLHAHMTRRAISPRLAIRTFLNIRLRAPGERPSGSNAEERLAVLDGMPVLVMDPDDLAGGLGLDLVHELHGFDDAQHLAHPDAVAHLDERRGVGVGRPVEGPHDGALDELQ